MVNELNLTVNIFMVLCEVTVSKIKRGDVLLQFANCCYVMVIGLHSVVRSVTNAIRHALSRNCRNDVRQLGPSGNYLETLVFKVSFFFV